MVLVNQLPLHTGIILTLKILFNKNNSFLVSTEFVASNVAQKADIDPN